MGIRHYTMGPNRTIETEDALYNHHRYEYVEVIDVDDGIVFLDEPTSQVKEYVREKGWTILDEDDVHIYSGIASYTAQAALTTEGRQEVALTGPEGPAHVSKGHEGEPFRIEGFRTYQEEWGKDTLLETNRGRFFVKRLEASSRNAEYDPDTIYTFECTYENWTGRDWDRKFKIVPFDEYDE